GDDVERSSAALEAAEPTITATTTGTITLLGSVKEKATSTTPATPMPGVKVTLSGAASGTVITNADGVYRFQNLPSGSYHVAVARSGATFSPSSVDLSLTGSKNQGFSCTPGCTLASPAVNAFKELVIVDQSVT